MFKKIGRVVMVLMLALSTLLLTSCKAKVSLKASTDIEVYVGDEINFNIEVDSKKVSKEDVLSNLEYTSNVENIIIVENGKVIASNEGTAVITISWAKDKDVFVNVNLTVKAKELEVNFDKVPETLSVGDTFTFKYLTEGVKVTYAVNDDKVAKIDGAKLTALAEGKVKVTATCTKDNTTKVVDFEINVVKTIIQVTYKNCEDATNPNLENIDIKNLPYQLKEPTKDGFKFLGWSLKENSNTYIKTISKNQKEDLTLYANWEEVPTKVVINANLNGGSFTWKSGKVTNPGNGINANTNLPEIFMADFYRYLNETGKINSSIINSDIRNKAQSWKSFSTLDGDPQALYNETSTGGYGTHDGYNQFFWDTLDGEKAVGGFLGTSPFKEKYANLTSIIVKLTKIKYPNIKDDAFKAGAGFVLDGYFYGTQGLLKAGADNANVFNTLRAFIPTPTKGHDGLKETTNTYEVLEGELNQTIQLVEPSKEGYIFAGWYLTPNFEGERVTEVNKSCTVYAKWQDLTKPMPTHKITYVLNGGTLDTKVETYNEWSIVELPIPTFSKHRFLGWSLVEGGTEFIKTTESTWKEDVTLYANWAEDDTFKITYIYDEGNLPTHIAKDLNEFANTFWNEFYEWSKTSQSLDEFKNSQLANWKSGDTGKYALYLQDGQGVVDDNYFINAKENIDTWGKWMDVFDKMVNAINPDQTAWGSNFVGYIRLYSLLNRSAGYWTDERVKNVYEAYPITTKLVKGYKPGEEFDLVGLVIDDGRTFLGWFDEKGNKIDKVTKDFNRDLVLTARWSASTPLEDFKLNKVDKMLKFSEYQLTWSFVPANATNKSLQFKSSNPKVASINENGLITANKEGTTTITVTVLGNETLTVTYELTVYVDPYIDGHFETTSVIKPNEKTNIIVSLIGADGKIMWKSLDETIATVDECGCVKGVKPGYVDIQAYVQGREDVKLNFGVTVTSPEEDPFFDLISKSHNNDVHVVYDLDVSEKSYKTDVIGSVSDILFNYDYKVNRDMMLDKSLRTETMSKIEFICVHYSGTPGKTATGRALATSLKNNYNGTCWHYSVGNDGVFQSLENEIRAAHAGDGLRSVGWTDSGVKAPGYVKPTFGKQNGYVTLNGIKSSIKLPAGTENYPFTFYGPGWRVGSNGNYEIAQLWNPSGQGYYYIGSAGGNMNSIGIETACNKGSDLWLTYQITSKLVSSLLLKYNLDFYRVTGHHMFSGKDCPETLLAHNGDLWYKFMECVEAEYYLSKDMKDYSISCQSNNPDILADNGRIIKVPNSTTTVSYTVTVTNNKTSVAKSATYSSVIHGRYLK